MQILLIRKDGLTIGASRNVQYLLKHLSSNHAGLASYDSIMYQRRKKEVKFFIDEYEYEFIDVLVQDTPTKANRIKK